MGGMGKAYLYSVKMGLSCALVALCVQAAEARPVKTPRLDWAREDSPDQPTTLLRHKARRAAILMTVDDTQPGQELIDKLIASVSEKQSYKVIREWPREQVERAQVQRGFSFVLDNGQRGIFAVVWRPTRDGKMSAAAYVTTDLTTPEKSQADFLLVRSFNNQLRRGALPGQQAFSDGILPPTLALIPPAPKPPTAAAPVIAAAPSTAETMIVQSAMTPVITAPKAPATATAPTTVSVNAAVQPQLVQIPVQTPVQTTATLPMPAPIPVSASMTAPQVQPRTQVASAVQPALVKPTAVQPAAVKPTAVQPTSVQPTVKTPTATQPTAALALPSAQPPYPYTAAPGAKGAATGGTKPSQISAILYAPLEFSEVYVLFKDGSFHENLPVALEDWNIGASRKSDPDSWGKWSKTSSATDYELRYAADDKVTISGAKVMPAAPGLTLNGAYATETVVTGNPAPGSAQSKNVISFAGGSFTQTSPSGTLKGRYRLENYTIILTFDDGREARLPFFIIPPEEGETDELIWLGNEVRVKLDNEEGDDAPEAA
jgi:hypothetical protein